HNLTVVADGTTAFQGVVGAGAALTSVTTEGSTTLATGTTDINTTAITTTGAQTYANAVSLSASPTLTTTNSLIDFASTVDDATAGTHSLAVSTGTGGVTFGGVVGTTHPLLSLDTTGTTGTITLDGNVTTSGGQTYTGAATLGVDDTLTGSTVTFGSTVDGAHALTVTGNLAFDGAVGSGTNLASLGVSGTSDLDGGSVTTSGAQTYTGAAALGVDDTLAGSMVTFGSTVDGAHALTVTGNLAFDGAVGSGTNLASLGVSGTSDLNGGSVTTSGAQTYTGAAALSADDTLAGSMVTFGSTVDGAHALTVTGNLAFDGAVGSGTKLAVLGVSGTSDLNGGSVTTSGAQTYTGAATLSADDTLTGSTVSFGSTVDGAHALTVTGNLAFDGAVGSGTKLTVLGVSGTSDLNGGSVTTSGAQTYTGAATLGANTALTSTGTGANGNITFGVSAGVGGTVDGGFALTTESDGTTNFYGQVGHTTALASLLTEGVTSPQTGTTDLNGGGVTTTGLQTYENRVMLSEDTSLATTDSLVDFVSTVDDTVSNAHSLTVSAGSGGVTFGAAVGGTRELRSLDTSGTTGTNTLDGNVTTSDQQTYSGPVTMTANNTVLTSTDSGAITFGGNFSTANKLTVDSTTGALLFEGNASFGSLSFNVGSLNNTTGTFVDNRAGDTIILNSDAPSSLNNVTVAGTIGQAAASEFYLNLGSNSLHINGFLALPCQIACKINPTLLEHIGLAVAQGQIEEFRKRLNRGGAGETAAQQAFLQFVDQPNYGVDPFALKYNILGLGPMSGVDFNDISYIMDGFWVNLLNKHNH
ncbi:MAG: beta strand repeat-containing protein, partial [Stellaceae bacterium]